MLIEQSNLASRSKNRISTHDSTPQLQVDGDNYSERQRGRAMELRAAVILHSHPYLQRYSGKVQCCFRDDCLYVTGQMPSYYLKQLAQESLRELPGVARIENRIVVSSSVQVRADNSGDHSFNPHFRRNSLLTTAH